MCANDIFIVIEFDFEWLPFKIIILTHVFPLHRSVPPECLLKFFFPIIIFKEFKDKRTKEKSFRFSIAKMAFPCLSSRWKYILNDFMLYPNTMSGCLSMYILNIRIFPVFSFFKIEIWIEKLRFNIKNKWFHSIPNPVYGVRM